MSLAILVEGLPKNICVNYFEISPLVQEEMLFEETVDGQTDLWREGRLTNIDHNSSP